MTFRHSVATGRLVNRGFTLSQPLRVAISFAQSIVATESLRTGSYDKTLTFALTTANP